jgi:hypothetical protein
MIIVMCYSDEGFGEHGAGYLSLCTNGWRYMRPQHINNRRLFWGRLLRGIRYLTDASLFDLARDPGKTWDVSLQCPP